MCAGCWIDLGRPDTLPERWQEIVWLIGELYSLNETAGPLHTQIDDYNVDDLWRPGKGYGDEETQVAEEICELMVTLTADERAAVVAEYHGWIEMGRAGVV